MHKILQTLCSFNPMAFGSGGGGENFHTQDSPDLGGGGYLEKGRRRLNESVPSPDCEN